MDKDVYELLKLMSENPGVSDYWKQRIVAILARVQHEPKNYCEVVEDNNTTVAETD